MPDAAGVGVQLTDNVQGSPGKPVSLEGQGLCPLLSFGDKPLYLPKRSHCERLLFTHTQQLGHLPADLASQNISLLIYPRVQACREVAT